MHRQDSGRNAWTLSAACILLATLLVVPYRSYVTDDTYIHLQFARNLLAGHGWSFNAGEPTYGFTSTLWVLLLTAAGKLGLGGLPASKVLGLVCTWGSILAFQRAAQYLIPSRESRIAAVVVWTLNAWQLRWTLSGMETSLVSFLVLAGFALHLRERKIGGLPWASGFCFGLAALSRPECIGLVLLAVVDHLWVDRPARRKRLGGFAAGSGIVLLPWLWFVLREFGQVFPDTLFAKAGALLPTFSHVVRVGYQALGVIGSTNGGEVLAALAVAVWATHKSPGAAWRWLREHFLLVGWLTGIVLLFTIWGTVLVSRYFVPALGMVVLLGFLAIDRLRSAPWLRVRHARLAARAPWICLGLFGVQNLVLLYAVALPPTLAFSRGLETSLVAIGRWADDNTAPEATIAAPDIGALGYFSERTILDLSGLITPAMREAQREQTLDEFVATLSFAEVAKPDYLVDRFEEPDRFASIPEAAGIAEMVFYRRIGPLGIRRRGDFYYTVYRMHWDHYQAPSAPVHGSSPARAGEPAKSGGESESQH